MCGLRIFDKIPRYIYKPIQNPKNITITGTHVGILMIPYRNSTGLTTLPIMSSYICCYSKSYQHRDVEWQYYIIKLVSSSSTTWTWFSLEMLKTTHSAVYHVFAKSLMRSARSFESGTAISCHSGLLTGAMVRFRHYVRLFFSILCMLFGLEGQMFW